MRNINNLRYADDTTLMAENKEELKGLLMKVKEENIRMGKTKVFFKKIRDTKGIFHASSVQSLSPVRLFATP